MVGPLQQKSEETVIIQQGIDQLCQKSAELRRGYYNEQKKFLTDERKNCELTISHIDIALNKLHEKDVIENPYDKRISYSSFTTLKKSQTTI